MTKPTRRTVLEGIAVTGSGVVLPTGRDADTPNRMTGGGRATAVPVAQCGGAAQPAVSTEEARFLAEQASMRADLFDGFAKRFEDPELLKQSNFLPSAPVEEIAEVVGLAENDEAPENHVSVRSSSTELDEWLIGQVGLWADMALIATGMTPIVGNAIELVEKLQWFADIARQSSLQQVFNQGLQGCGSCPPGGRGLDGAAARSAKSTNETLAKRARKTAEAANRQAESPTTGNARLVADRLAAEYRASAETAWIDAWATIDPNAYNVAAAGLDVPKSMKRLGTVNAAAIDRIRKVICFQRGVLTNADQRLVLPAAVRAHNENIDAFREDVPNLVLDRFMGEAGNLFIVDGSGDGVRTSSVIGFEIGPKGRFTDYSLTPIDSDFDAYVKREAASMIASGKLTNEEARKLATMDAISIDGNGIVNSVKYGLIDTFISELLKRVATNADENQRVSR